MPVDAGSPERVEAAAAPRQLRCGWLDNPTPGNWWLTDKDGEWTIAEQGAEDEWAKGMDRITEFGKDWKVTNSGDHGYGCACLSVTVEPASKRVTEIESVRVLPLARCKGDKALSQKGR